MAALTSTRRLLLLLLMTLAAQAAHAWGTQGHRVVAELAWTQLTPQARDAANRLLALEPGATLASVSTWADDTRDEATRQWHFVNFPRGSCTYDPLRDCPDGQCVIAAIERQMAVLGSNAPDIQRLVALKYVVHLVADVHQPLHAGHADDRGGNLYQLQAFGNGSNLHAVWDTGLLRERNETVKALVRRLQALPASTLAQDLDLSSAARASCQIVDKHSFYPPRNLPDDYATHFAPILDQQLALAAARLAGWLNRVLHH